jgi:hypothetical protein
VEGSCEYGNEPSGSIKCWEVLEWLHNWRLLKKSTAPWSQLARKVAQTFCSQLKVSISFYFQRLTLSHYSINKVVQIPFGLGFEAR